MPNKASRGRGKKKPVIDDRLIGTLGAYVAEGGRRHNSGKESMGGPNRATTLVRGRGRGPKK